MKILLRLILVVLVTATCPEVQAQQRDLPEIGSDSTKVYRIEMNDGSVYVGSILYRDAVKIIIKTSAIPRVELLVINLTRIEEVKDENFRKGVYWFTNPHTSRYFYGPSAIPLKKGEGYFQNTWLLLNSFQVGVTDNISIGGGFEITTLLSRSDRAYTPIFFLTPKVSFKVSKSLHLGGGLLYVNIPTNEDGSRGSFGITYGVATYGNKDYNLSGGLGWGYVEGHFSSKPAITLSGTARVAKKVAVITENWFLPGETYYGIASYGIRIMGESTAFDLAFVINPDIARAFPFGFPFVSYTLRF